MSQLFRRPDNRWLKDYRRTATSPLADALAGFVRATDALITARDQTAFHIARHHFQDPDYSAEEMAALETAMRLVNSLNLGRVSATVSPYEDDQGLPVSPIEVSAEFAAEHELFLATQARLVAKGLDHEQVGAALVAAGWELED